MAGVDPVLIFVPILCQRSSCPVRKCVHMSENSEIGSKNIFCITIIIVSSSDKFFLILLCIKITMYIIHDALCHHASCYVIITNCMIDKVRKFSNLYGHEATTILVVSNSMFIVP
jgi:hypothetical protein